MSKIPFSVYDFFAYLSSGGLLVAALDYSFGFQWLAQSKVPVPTALVLVFAAYLTGQLLAQLSKALLEDGLVASVLERPTKILLSPPANTLTSKLFPGYFKPLPEPTQSRVRERAEELGITGKGESLFLHVYGVVTQNKDSQARLDEFRNLYGFCRNTCLSLISSTIVLSIGHWCGAAMPKPWLVVVPAVFALAMLYRYLKFFRQFSYQLFLTYAERTAPEEQKATS